MNISQNGINLIKSFEGLFLKAYDDGAGVCTIGYGHTGSDVYYGQTITEERAEQLLREDLQGSVNDVNRAIEDGVISFNLNQNQFDALVSFTFNCGAGSLYSLCNNRDSATVAEKLLLYHNDCNGNFMQGLQNRRNKERVLFLDGNISSISNTKNTNEYEEHGNAVVLVNCLNVRTEPNLTGKIVAQYSNGETIYNYDRVYDGDGYRWIRYKGNSGNYRYVAVRDLSTNRRLCNCY